MNVKRNIDHKIKHFYWKDLLKEILKKGEKQFSRRDIFDFRNKISLLASMALRMFEVGGINYALKTSEAIAFIEDYLEVLNMDTLFNAKIHP